VTSTPAATSELDHLDQLGAKAFAGFLVRKDLVRNYSRQYPVPTYVYASLLSLDWQMAAVTRHLHEPLNVPLFSPAGGARGWLGRRRILPPGQSPRWRRHRRPHRLEA